MNFLPVHIMFSVWFVGLLLLYIGYRSSLGKKYSDEGFKNITPLEKIETTPKYYPFVRGVGVMFFILLFLCAMFLFPMWFMWVQKMFYASDAVVFLASGSAWAYLIPSLFLGIFIGGLVIKKIYSFFPKFDQYQVLTDHVNFHTKGLSKEDVQKVDDYAKSTINTEKLAKSEWRSFFTVGLIIWFISVPLCILVIDNYYKITKDAFIINPFLSTHESYYKKSDIKSVQVYVDILQGEEGEYLKPVLRVGIQDISVDLWSEIGFWGSSPEELITLLEIFHSWDVPIIVSPLTNEHLEVMSRKTDDVQLNIKSVFEYAESLE